MNKYFYVILLLLFLNSGYAMTSDTAPEQINQVADKKITQSGGIVSTEIFDNNWVEYPWEEVPINTGFFLYPSESIKIEAQYAYYYRNEVFRFKIYDKDPKLYRGGQSNLVPSEKIGITFDIDRNKQLSTGDYYIEFLLGVDRSDVYSAVYRDSAFFSEENPYVAEVFVRYDQDIGAWETIFRVSTLLTPFKISENQILGIDYTNLNANGATIDAAFDNFVSTPVTEVSAKDTLFELKYPSFAPSIVINREYKKATTVPFTGPVNLHFQVHGQAPVLRFNFVEESPVPVQSFNGITGELGKMFIDRDRVSITIQSIGKSSEFTLTYYLNVPGNITLGEYRWPPVKISFVDISGTYQTMTIDTNSSIYLVKSLNGIRTNDKGEVITNTKNDNNPIKFSRTRVDPFSFIVQILSLIVGSVAIFFAVKGFILTMRSGNLAKVFQKKAENLVFNLVEVFRDKDPTYLKNFLNRVLADSLEYRDQLEQFIESNPGNKDAVDFIFGKFKLKLAERLEIFFRDDPNYKVGLDLLEKTF